MTVLLSIINMIHSIGCSIVAEGVETEAQANYFKECGIEFLQGFYFSRPLSSELILEYVEQNDETHSPVETLSIIRN
jgi:EAL domain-containing protein (putative c-di-GMP-specific phosphodiesterase class I)